MNTRFKNAAFAAITLLGLAATTAAHAADTGYVNIQRLAPYGTYTQVQVPLQISCGGVSSNQPRIISTSTNGDRNFSVALAALLSGKQVDINYNCNGTVAEIVVVRIKP
jgi:hypothetical protein